MCSRFFSEVFIYFFHIAHARSNIHVSAISTKPINLGKSIHFFNKRPQKWAHGSPPETQKSSIAFSGNMSLGNLHRLPFQSEVPLSEMEHLGQSHSSSFRSLGPDVFSWPEREDERKRSKNKRAFCVLHPDRFPWRINLFLVPSDFPLRNGDKIEREFVNHKIDNSIRVPLLPENNKLVIDTWVSIRTSLVSASHSRSLFWNKCGTF